MSLTLEELRKIWKNEFMRDIRHEISKEVKTELTTLSMKVSSFEQKMNPFEKSLSFLSTKYDTVVQNYQDTKKDLANKDQQINHLRSEVEMLRSRTYDMEVDVDSLQQYGRRDCLEIHGIPVVPNDDPTKLVIEMANTIGINISRNDISTAHRLPPTRKTKDRLIVKFTRRQTKDLIYSKRSAIKTKRSKDLPTVAAEPESTTVPHKARIFINESLTIYRKKLFGRIAEFKKKHDYKFLWTVNGKIFLRADERSSTHSFTTDEGFEDFIEAQGIYM